jgi:hypothetical protein
MSSGHDVSEYQFLRFGSTTYVLYTFVMENPSFAITVAADSPHKP